MKIALFFTVVVAAFVFPLAVTSADETRVTVGDRTVSYAGVNMRSEAGADRILRRIRRAAEFACGDGGPGQIIAQQSCVRHAVGQAVDDVGSSLVSARYRRGALEPAYARPFPELSSQS